MDNFKSQIIHVVQSVDKLDLPDRIEAFSYLQKITEAFKNNSLPSDLSANTFPKVETPTKTSTRSVKHKCKNHLCLSYNIKHLKKIACFKCDKRLDSEIQLFEHSQTHLDYPSSCLHCRCLFRNSEDFESHKAADCRQPNKDGSQNVEKYRCNVCNDSFAYKKAFQSHLLDNHGMKLYNNWYSCKLCREMFEQKKMLFHHYKQAHSEMNHQWEAEQKKKNATSSQANASGQEEGDKMFQCAHCSRSFHKKCILSVHVKRHLQNNTFMCNPCKRSFSCYKYYRRHLQSASHQSKDGSDSHPLFKCDQCENRVFANRDLLAQHRQRCHNTNEKRLKCPLCDFKTGLATSLTRHINLHTDNRKFICDQCGACFHTSSALKEHTACIHSNERNYSCEICGQRFKLKSGLNRHFKTHSDDKEFKCSFCNQVYKFRTNLKRHLANAHKQRDQRKRVFRVTTEEQGYALNNPKKVQRKMAKPDKTNTAEVKIDDFDISALSGLSDVDLSCADEVTNEVLRQTYDKLAKFSAENGDSQESFNAILGPMNNIIDRVLQESGNELRVPRLPALVDVDKQYSVMNGDPVEQHELRVLRLPTLTDSNGNPVAQHLPSMNYRPVTCRHYMINPYAELTPAGGDQYSPPQSGDHPYSASSYDLSTMSDGYNKQQYSAGHFPQSIPAEDDSSSFAYTRWLNEIL